MRVLIVEDEKRLADALCAIVQAQKYQAEAVDNGEDGLRYALDGAYDVIVLDVMLPGMDGFALAKALRAQKNATPILMLTAKDELASKVTGLDCGADDYMTKPFAPEELMARIRALTRRQGEVVLEELEFHDLVLCVSSYDLVCGGKSVRLAHKEFELMRILMSNPNVIVPKEDLIVKIWGADSEAEDNNVEAYISFLRKKLFYLESEVTIGTIRKVGYRLEAKLCSKS